MGMNIRWKVENFQIQSIPIMANTYYQVYIQCIFAVKYRDAVIDQQWRSTLHAVIGNLINETGCKTIIVNGIEDHVHCFFGLKPAVSISELMKTVKAKSSKYINDHRLTYYRFEWQEGFGAFSYSHSQINEVFRYIANQEAHHRQQTFKEEYITILDKFQVPYDERYIFADLMDREFIKTITPD
jgi:REP element-mobilizing transposase RayT